MSGTLLLLCVLLGLLTLGSGTTLGVCLVIVSLLGIFELSSFALNQTQLISMTIMFIALPIALRVFVDQHISIGLHQRAAQSIETLVLLSAMLLVLQNAAIERLVLFGSKVATISLLAQISWLNLFLISLALSLLPLLLFELAGLLISASVAPKLRNTMVVLRPICFVFGLMFCFEVANRMFFSSRFGLNLIGY